MADFRGSDPETGPATVEDAAKAILSGRVVAVPTETVYGLAADATNPHAVAAIYAAKGRPSFNPLIVHVSSFADARRLGAFGDEGRRLSESFWPGPLTMVVPAAPDSPVADLVTAGLSTVALRVPSHPVMQRLLAAVGRPLAAPSANLSGHVSATNAAHVASDFTDGVMILDAGPSTVGVESTILSLVGTSTLLRPGAISVEEIERVLGRPVGLVSAGDGIAAPGMLTSHYAPSVPLRLEAETVGHGEALLAFGRTKPPGADRAAATINLSETGDLAEAAARLFAALRELDALGAPIAVAPIPDRGLGAAINDRLRRAAAPRG